MSLLLTQVKRVLSMGGCVCSRESVAVDGVSYRVIEHLAEG